MPEIGDRIVTVTTTKWWKPGETGVLEIKAFSSHTDLWWARFEDGNQWTLRGEDFRVEENDPQLSLF